MAPRPVRQHALHRLLRNQEAAIGADGDCVGDGGGVQIGERAAGAGAGVVDHDVGRLDRVEQAGHVGRLRGVGGDRLGTGFATERGEFSGVPRAPG